MSETHQKKPEGEPKFPNVLRLRRAILSNENLQGSDREAIVKDLDKLVREVQRSRGIIHGMEGLLKSLLEEAGWISEYTKDVSDRASASKTFSERLLGGALVKRKWLESALRRLQDTEQSRREGHIG